VRVVSLVPSATETLEAMGVTPIACTRFCDRGDLSAVGGTKDPDLASILALSPDLVVMDREENRREDHEALVDAGVAVHVVELVDVADLDAEMRRLAEATGGRWSPVELGEPRPSRGRVWVPIWRRPWMALGRPTYGASMLAHLGWEVVTDGAYVEEDPSAAGDRDVDRVVAPDEPFPFGERHRSELEVLAPTVFVDGRDLFWWGARSGEASAGLERALVVGP
jgi:hypothetical protein